MNGDEERQVFKLAAFPLGIQSEKRMGRPADPRALIDGENLDLSGGTIRTRKGSDTISTGSLPSGSVQLLKQAQFPRNELTRLLAQVDTGSANKLYASKTVLPSTTVTFSEIYDLSSGAGILDLAQLNDRSILTEKVKNRPLAWPGVMETDGTDFTVPKQVLLTLDGTNFHDITDDVTDGDSSTSADIGGMTSASALYVNTGLHKVSDIGIDLGVVNSTSEASTVTVDCDPEDESHFTQPDLKATIAKWVKDYGAHGHFTNSGGTPLTLGVGNDCPDVEVGLKVIFASGSEAYIKTITGDGEATGEVELTTTISSQNVTYIYGLEVDSNGYISPCLGVNAQNDSWAEVSDTGPPSARRESSSAYDPINKGMWVWGGRGVSTYNELWFYNIAANTWTQYTSGGVANAGFGISNVSGFAYDSKNHCLWLHGGAGDADQFWKYDIASDVWTQMSTASIPSRYGHPMIYDSVDHCLMFFGGYDSSTQSDLWKYDITTNTWTEISDTSPPGARYGHAAAYDPVHNYMIVGFGDTGAAYYNDAWRYDITNNIWTQLTTTGTKGDDRAAVAYCYDSINHQFIVYAGYDGVNQDELNMLDLTTNTWTAATTTGDPSARRAATAIFDPENGDVLIFGGYIADYTDELWKYHVSDKTPPTQQLLAHTNNLTNLSTLAWTHLNSVAITASVAGSATAYYAACKNYTHADEEWKVFLGAAWQGIAKLESGTWKYYDGAAWQVATVNSRFGAFDQAFADADNQWAEAAVEAMDVNDWEASGGFVPGTTDELAWAVAITANGADVAKVDKWVHTIPARTIVEGWTGKWEEGAGFSDGTKTGGIPFGQDGILAYQGASPMQLSYHHVADVAGFFLRIRLPAGTASGTTLVGLSYKGPCQELQKIAPDGLPDIPAAVVYYDASAASYKDITEDVTDDAVGTAQFLNDGASTPTGWGSSDALFIGYPLPFSSVELTPGSQVGLVNSENNSVTAELTEWYWTGTAWSQTSDFADGTSSGGACLAQTGRLTASLPTDWRQNNPIGGTYHVMYWKKYTVDASLTATLSLAEVRVFPVPTPLKKYAHCTVKLDRLVLGGPTWNPSQMDFSRKIEEYGIQSGADAWSFSPGSQDSIVAMTQLYNEALVFTQNYCYLIAGDTPDDFTTERLDVGGQVPINSRCLVLAPHVGQETSLQVAAYYLNYSGVFAFAGFQTRVFTGLQRLALGDLTDWWDENTRPYLDKDYLHLACGEYWPEKNLVIFAVPMIVDIPLNAGSAVANKGGGKVGLPCTGHGLASGTSIVITGLVNYSGTKTVDATSTANEIVITATYVAETVTEAGAVHKVNQTSNNRLIAFDVKRGCWYPPISLASTALCTALDRNTSAPGNLGERMLLMGNSTGKVIRLFEDDYADDDGTAIAWSGKTGFIDLGTPERKRITKVTCQGLTAGSSVYLKIFINGRKALVSSSWSLTFTGIASLSPKRGYTYHILDPGLHGIYEAQFQFGGTGQADVSFEIEYEVDPADRAETGTIEDTGHEAYEV